MAVVGAVEGSIIISSQVCYNARLPRFATEKLIHYQPGIPTTMNPNEVSMHICNAPFCNNSRNYNHAWCGEHRWEREKYKIKPYKELLPFWCLKRCDVHGYLKPHQVYVNPCNKIKLCIQCKKKVPYCPIKNKENTIKYSVTRKSSRLKKRYGIDNSEYQSLLLKQNSCCAICKISINEHENQKGTRFAVDHCHNSNKVRGLLCYKCNMGLGYFNDNPELTQAATNYLYIK